MSRIKFVAFIGSLTVSVAAMVVVWALVLGGAPAAADTLDACPTELFFSEYIEGSGNNKALEIYNSTGSDITFTGQYSVALYSNGSATPGNTLILNGATLANGDVYVIANANAVQAVLDEADITSNVTWYNGDDAIALFKDGVIIDVIGQIGFDPGSYWGTEPNTTQEHTLVRRSNIMGGDADGSDAFDPADEWDAYAQDTFTYLGSHTIDPCGAAFDITKTAPDMVNPGQVFTYTIVVANSTGVTTTGTVITDVIPTNADFASASDGGALVGDTVVWAIIGDFVDGDVVTRTFQVTATSSIGADIVNEDYGVRATNWVTLAVGSPITTSVSPLDLVVAKAGPEYAVFGENVIYTITLSNIGVTTATNVILTDTLPISTTYVSDSSGVTPTRPTSTTVVWNFGDVPSDTVRAFNLTVKIAEPPPGTLFLPLLNRVEISTDTPGDDPSNNTAASIGTVYPLVSIHDIQYVTGPASNDVSPYDGWFVWVEGVVVAGTGEIGSGSNNFVIEHPDGGPWSGLLVYNGGTFTDVVEGDYVRLLGQVDEYYGMTEIMIRYAPHVQRVISTGNALPTPEFITTGLFATAVPTTAEAYESVLIEFRGATVTDEDLGHGEWEIDDGTGATRADDFGGSDGDLTYTPELGDVYDFIRGIGWYSYGDYKLEPRYDADIFIAPKLSVNKTVYPMADVELGSVVVYTVTVANRGDREATGVVITDPLPSAITFGGYVSNPGGTAQLPDPTGVITWMYPVAAGAGYTFVFTATVTTDTAYYGADVTNSVYFTSDNANNGAGSAVFAIRDLNHIYLPLILRNSSG